MLKHKIFLLIQFLTRNLNIWGGNYIFFNNKILLFQTNIKIPILNLTIKLNIFIQVLISHPIIFKIQLFILCQFFFIFCLNRQCLLIYYVSCRISYYRKINILFNIFLISEILDLLIHFWTIIFP